MSRSRFLLVFALVLVLRIAVAARFRGNFDTQSFLIVVRGVLSGQNIYALTDRYNYSPVWAFVAAGVWKLSGGNVGAFVLLVGLLQTAGDAAAAGLHRRDRAAPPAAVRGRGPPPGAALFLQPRLGPDLVRARPVRRPRDPVASRGAVALGAAAVPEAAGRCRGAPLGLASRQTRDDVSSAPVFAPPGARGAPGPPRSRAVRRLRGLVSSVRRRAARHRPQRAPLRRAARGPVLETPGGLQAFFSVAGPRRAVFAFLLLAAVAGILRETRRWELSRASLALFLVLIVFSPSYAVQYARLARRTRRALPVRGLRPLHARGRALPLLGAGEPCACRGRCARPRSERGWPRSSGSAPRLVRGRNAEAEAPPDPASGG